MQTGNAHGNVGKGTDADRPQPAFVVPTPIPRAIWRPVAGNLRAGSAVDHTTSINGQDEQKVFVLGEPNANQAANREAGRSLPKCRQGRPSTFPNVLSSLPDPTEGIRIQLPILLPAQPHALCSQRTAPADRAPADVATAE